MIEYNPFWFVVLMAIGILFIGISIYFMAQIVHGQDFDQRYACLYKDKHPFNEMCFDQELEKFLEKYYNYTLSR